MSSTRIPLSGPFLPASVSRGGVLVPDVADALRHLLCDCLTLSWHFVWAREAKSELRNGEERALEGAIFCTDFRELEGFD